MQLPNYHMNRGKMAGVPRIQKISCSAGLWWMGMSSRLGWPDENLDHRLRAATIGSPRKRDPRRLTARLLPNVPALRAGRPNAKQKFQTFLKISV
jgi:hypothetical protein